MRSDPGARRDATGPEGDGTRARLIDRVVADEPGPTLILTCAVHGNEPAGVHAARRVAVAVRSGAARLVRGELVA
ncbi:MAG: hypothetical protein ACF8Q5_03010, partial [Phycisphaerales bacterium JB040]